MSQLIERFEFAVEILIGQGTVKHRLSSAYARYLEDLQGLELPMTADGAFKDLHAALHRVPPMGTETSVNASVRKMSGDEAAVHAGTIVRLYAELLSHSRRAEPLQIVEVQRKAPPRFLVGG
jgi:hypothetical protein